MWIGTRKINAQQWGDSPVGKGFALQGQRLEFHPYHIKNTKTKKVLGRMVSACSPSAGEAEIGGLLGLTA